MQNCQGLNKIAQRIAQRRKELNLSLQDIANIAGISRSTLQRYESGAIKNIPLQRLEGLAVALKTTPEWILGTDYVDLYYASGDLVRNADWLAPSPEDINSLVQKQSNRLLPLTPNSTYTLPAYITSDEELLIYCYRAFNKEGQQKIREYISDLRKISTYLISPPENDNKERSGDYCAIDPQDDK